MSLVWVLFVMPIVAQPPAPAPPKPVYAYAGKPLTLEAQCGSKQIEDLGLVCTEEEPCPVYLELSGVESAGGRLFLAGNFHTESSILASLLLVSDDEGRSFTEAHPRLPNSLLDQIQFVDGQTGFVSGNVAGSLAKDPFFLKTTDGGKTWRQLGVFEDGGFGVVGSFRFTSPAQGVLTIEGARGRGRYRRMETMTGGESWMTRELLDQAPARAKTAPAASTPAAEWRVRGEAATRTLRLERREAGKWTLASAFALRSGACKPDPAPSPQPNPPPGTP
jgi:hypothetical protein